MLQHCSSHNDLKICARQGSQVTILTYFGKINEFLGPERFRIQQAIIRPIELEKHCLLPLSTELRSHRKSVLQKKKTGTTIPEQSYIRTKNWYTSSQLFFVFHPCCWEWDFLGFCRFYFVFTLGPKPLQAWQSSELQVTQLAFLCRWWQVSMFHDFTKVWHVLTTLQQSSSSHNQTIITLERWSQTLHCPEEHDNNCRMTGTLIFSRTFQQCPFS